jgi:3',5'-cyclic AMP phosphodiesterase CpdA
MSKVASVPCRWLRPRLVGSGLAECVVLLSTLGCGGIDRRPGAEGTTPDASLPSDDVPDAPPTSIGRDSSIPDSIPDGGVTESGDALPFQLVGAPLAYAPTAQGFGLCAVVANGDPSILRAHVRPAGSAAWGPDTTPTVPTSNDAQWLFTGLQPAPRYEYEVIAHRPEGDTNMYAGSLTLQRPVGQPFTFALMSDTHVGASLTYSNQGTPSVVQATSAEVDAAAPDFLINLGDMLDFHEYGFNDPPPTSTVTGSAYINYRTLLGDTLGHAAHFATIGNWEGENGSYTSEEMSRSMRARWWYVPGPGATTYPEGASPNEDYYAFTWGDALFIVLNVMSYTPTEHLLGSGSGTADDWTLGTTQLNWFATTLANATAKWRFLFIHHTVGGAAGDPANSSYGRGGGQAAHVGEQAEVHQLMLQYGAQIFFYGHDHVFTDMTVDGIHYTLPGSAGAPWLFTQAETGYAQQWNVSGWSKVTVSPDQVHVQLIQTGGDVLYEYTLP